jgi:hypothetical protein
MTARDFCYWLQGKLEIDGEAKALSVTQVETIQKHLAMVFVHDIDPKAGGAQKQDILNAIHGLGKPPSGVVARC